MVQYVSGGTFKTSHYDFPYSSNRILLATTASKRDITDRLVHLILTCNWGIGRGHCTLPHHTGACDMMYVCA